MRKKKYIILILIGFVFATQSYAQFSYGTTGLLHMPSADMQRDKTIMLGGSFLNKEMTPAHWGYNTLNYYLNVTILPWIEVTYDLTLHKGQKTASGFWPKKTWGKFVNQDRAFSARFRLWKEGWKKDWTPQIVFGWNDPGSHERAGGGEPTFSQDSGTNAFWTRMYLAATKHFDIDGIGEVGGHVALMRVLEHNNHFNTIAIGSNFQPHVEETPVTHWLINNWNVIMEYDGEGINFGGKYRVWRDNINLVWEMHEGKYFSGGIYFKLHLK